MRLRSLEARIVGFFLLLILLVQLAGFVTIRAGINENARAAVQTELQIGERVFRRLLDQNAQKLTTAARVLALDYGFRQAIGTNDKETIGSVLANHGARIGAAQTLLVSLDRHLISASELEPGAALEQSILGLVDAAERTGSATGIRLVDQHPYQIVLVPVKAPLTIGWVAMAFSIDQSLINDMRELSSLQVTILTRDKLQRWRIDVTTLSSSEATAVAAQLAAAPMTTVLPSMTMGSNEFSARSLPLAADEGHESIVVLQRSLSEAIAPYERLQLTLLLLTAGCTIAAIAISIFSARQITRPLRALTQTARRLGRGDYQGELEIRRYDEIGALSRAFESMRDDIARRELAISRLAYWDSLTDLPNRAQFINLLNSAIAEAATSATTCQILMLDLDRFKNVNDVLGHQFGDALLQQVAQRLRLQLAQSTYAVARLGGDEFVVLLPAASVGDALGLAARILKAMEQPISLEDQTVDLGAGIGVASYPQHGEDAEALLRCAEVAMYAAKKSGNEAVLYDPAIDRGSQVSLSLLGELRRAIDQDEFRLQVQPKVVLATGRVIGLEALIRWHHPVRGMVFPDEFIPFAEQTGFIRVLTRWVLEQSAVLCRDLSARGLHLKLSVNLSARDLLDQGLPQKFAEILKRHGVAPSSFCLEITESTIMDDPVRALQTLEGLHQMGVELAIDDFGTGYSSLAYLKRLPVDELKIDKSFVMNMEHDASDTQIVRSTIDLGHNMGLRVVAEGIESAAVWQLLTALGCDQGQGYFISRPMPAERFADWFAQWSAPGDAAALHRATATGLA